MARKLRSQMNSLCTKQPLNKATPIITAAIEGFHRTQLCSSYLTVVANKQLASALVQDYIYMYNLNRNFVQADDAIKERF